MSNRIDRWLFRARPAEPLPLRLGQRRIFVLPSPFGLAFAATLLVMLLTSINYSLSLGYALTFGLGGIGVVSIFHAFRNLLHLEIHAAACSSVHAGDLAQFAVRIRNTAARSRIALQLAGTGQTASQHFDLAPYDDIVVRLALPATARGWMFPGRLTLRTTYPIGLIRAWSVFVPDLRCLVYPRPESPPQALPTPSGSGRAEALGSAGDDDFSGLRKHQPSDPPGHVAWRLAARSERMLTKQFKGGSAAELQLGWPDLPNTLGTEEKLGRLTRWVMMAEASGARYALGLPGLQIPAGNGPAHRDRCLRRLALFGNADG